MKELEGKKSEEALPLVQKKYVLWRYQNESDEARWLQRSESSRRTRKEADTQDLLSFESRRSSAVDHIEEASLEPPRKMQDVQEVMGESAGNATRGRGDDAWRLEPEGETETLETKVVSDRVEGVRVDLDGECHHERGQVKKLQKAK